MNVWQCLQIVCSINVTFLDVLLFYFLVNLPTDPEYFKSFENQGGLNNFYITVENEDEGTMVSLGVWHFLPEPLLDETVHNRKNYQKSLRNSSFSVLLYFHGSGETRADLLKKCYKLRLNFHVIIFDYRGEFCNISIYVIYSIKF